MYSSYLNNGNSKNKTTLSGQKSQTIRPRFFIRTGRNLIEKSMTL